jgi:hypothetical protein
MAVTYFGHEQLAGDNTTLDAISKYVLAGYTCPGSGTQNVISLELGVAGVSAAPMRGWQFIPLRALL